MTIVLAAVNLDDTEKVMDTRTALLSLLIDDLMQDDMSIHKNVHSPKSQNRNISNNFQLFSKVPFETNTSNKSYLDNLSDYTWK